MTSAKLFHASYHGDNSYTYHPHFRYRSNNRSASKIDTLSILCKSKTIFAEASANLYARSTFTFNPAECEAGLLSRRPQLINYKRIRNLQIMIDYQSPYMSTVISLVHDSNCHVLCELAESDLFQGYPMNPTALVEFRESIVYAFFLNLPEVEQEVKTFTLCLEMEEDESLALLIDNEAKDPLVATGFVRTLTMLVDLRKVIIEFYGKVVSPTSKHRDEIQACNLFQRLSERLGPCIEEEPQREMGEEGPRDIQVSMATERLRV